MDEPEIRTDDREQLAYLLTEAAEIEHGLMCCYLYAAWSLKRDTSEGVTDTELKAVTAWRRAIVRVAVDEMTHLAIVNNLLASIGCAPHFNRQNFPVGPGYHPAGVVVSLAPFDAATLDHFVYLERPEGIDLPDGAGFEPPVKYWRPTRGDRLVPTAQDYATVGHLYRGIREGLVALAARLGEQKLFVGDPDAQVGSDMTSLPNLVSVVDLASALRSVDTIVEQGEGTAGDHEHSHYNRFIAVRNELRVLQAARPEFVPARPVARNPVMRKPPLPEGKVWIDDAVAARVVDLVNALYALAIHYLARGFGQSIDPRAARAVVVDGAAELMGLLSPVAEFLTTLPASTSNSGVNAGLSFTMVRTGLVVPQHAAAWTVLVERTREVAAGFERAGSIDPSLARTGVSLNALADRLERTPRV